MPRILVFTDWYLPGSKGGGSVSAISNLIDLVGNEFQFYVFTRNRDSTEDKPYSGIEFDQWVPVGKAQVFYASKLSTRTIRRRICEIAPHVIYLNSFFSRLTVKTLLLRKSGLIPPSAIVLAPRGEFSPAALDLKSFRKWLYRKLSFALGLYGNLVWQASSALEKTRLRASLNRAGGVGGANIVVASDVPNMDCMSGPRFGQRPQKESGSASFILLSRISPNKNQRFALELLGSAKGKIELDIYGPIEDRDYWEQCQDKIRKLPDQVRVNYKGAVSTDQVVEMFSKHHFQILPTLGENFGYVILEAFAGGCPVLISDQTPWRDLSKLGVGWDLPLDDRQGWLEAIQKCVSMDQATYELLSQRSRRYFEEWRSTTPYRLSTVELFRKALEESPNPRVPPALERSVGAGH